MLGVTERSIRNYVRTLNNNQQDEPLIVSSTQGYKIQQSLYNTNLKNELFAGDEDRLLFRIALILIDQKNFISFDELATRLHYSVESIRSKVQLLFAKINDLGINAHFESQIFTGIRVTGSESQLRLLLEQLVPIDRIEMSDTAKSITEVLKPIVSEASVEKQLSVMDEVFSKSHVTMDFIVYAKIACHLLIANYRIQDGFVLEDLTTSDIANSQFPEHKLARSLIEANANELATQNEIFQLTNYLISLPINIPSDYTPEIDSKQREVINTTLELAERDYSIPLYSNEQYRMQITNHIIRLLNPLEESIPIFNPYSAETKREYLFAYSIACYLYDSLENAFSIRIPESEIAYLAIHVQLILVEETKKPIKTLLIVQGKQAEAELFKYKIQTYFPTIKVEKISTNLSNDDEAQYPLIIVRGGLINAVRNRNVIEVSRVLNGIDLSTIKSFIDSLGTYDLISNLDYYQMDVASSQEALEFLLNKSGYGSFLPHFMQRESMSPTDIGNMVALPHPFLKGSETSAKIIIGINKRNIKWGKQNVRLVIIYIPAADLKTNKNFFSEVYQRTSDITLVQNLLKSQSKTEFIKIWNSKGVN